MANRKEKSPARPICSLDHDRGYLMHSIKDHDLVMDCYINANCQTRVELYEQCPNGKQLFLVHLVDRMDMQTSAHVRSLLVKHEQLMSEQEEEAFAGWLNVDCSTDQHVHPKSEWDIADGD